MSTVSYSSAETTKTLAVAPGSTAMTLIFVCFCGRDVICRDTITLTSPRPVVINTRTVMSCD